MIILRENVGSMTCIPPLAFRSTSQVLSSLRSMRAVVGCSMRFRTLIVTLCSWLFYLFIADVLLVPSAALGPRFYAWYRRGDGYHSSRVETHLHFS